MKYLIIDSANMFFRSRHVASKQNDDWTMIGFAIHSMLNSIQKCWRDHNADHVVFCFEGRSWRKDVYAPYKANRAVARAAKTEHEQELDRLFFEAFDDLKHFLEASTNCTTIQHEKLEADDLIAAWTQLHPNDQHVVVSTDSDFIQLVSNNVKVYNGVSDQLYTLDGIFDTKGKLVMDKKTNLPKDVPNPEWHLFEKCMRGDSGDNVFSAYPGVRTKSTKNKVGLTEAFADRNNKGFAWNNLMLQRWTDHEGQEHRVLDDFKRNQQLVDLRCQPEHIRAIMTECVMSQVPKSVPMIGAKFMKFCGKYELIKASENAQTFAEIFSATLPDHKEAA